jgi:hypothetical protein
MKTKFKLLLAVTALCFGSVQMSQAQDKTAEEEIADAKAAVIASVEAATRSGNRDQLSAAIASGLQQFPDLAGPMVTALLNITGTRSSRNGNVAQLGLRAIGVNSTPAYNAAVRAAFKTAAGSDNTIASRIFTRILDSFLESAIESQLLSTTTAPRPVS